MPSRGKLGRRGIAAIALAVIAGLLLTTGGVMLYVRAEIGDADAFSGRMVSALDEPAVREVVAGKAADGLMSATSVDLLAVRPLLSRIIDALLVTDKVKRAAGFGLADTHRALVAGEGSVIVRLEGTTREVVAALRSVSPALASRTSGDLRPVLTRVNRDNRALVIVRGVIDASRWGWWAVGGGVLAALGALLVAADRRRALGYLGISLVAGGALVVGLVSLGGVVVTDAIERWRELDADVEREALEAVWSALFGDLRTGGLILATAGVIVAALSAGATRSEGIAQRVGALAARVRIPAPVRRAVLIVAGAACLLIPSAAERGFVLVLGAVLLFLGLRDLAARVTSRSSGDERELVAARPGAVHARRRDTLLVAGGLVAVVAAVTSAAALALSYPHIPAPPPPPPAGGCNGSTALCDKRIDEAIWPTTHNSYAAADEPGWFFANQTRPISRQLDDGIRGLMLDVHWGVRDASRGRVRTDLQAEGMTRNKVARELGPQRLALADRLAGRVGAGDLQGKREIFLCHTLCELGAEPMDAELGVIRRFLDRNPREIVTIVYEPYVPPAQIEAAMRRTGLLRYAAELDRSEPLPTLGELIDEGHRLLVFAEEDGGTFPWYMPAFSYIQDTPLGAVTPGGLRCSRFRGDADSPILLMNHWIDRFPPRVSANARINRKAFLEQRIDRCTRERGLGPGLVGVDFYERGALVEVARERNSR